MFSSPLLVAPFQKTHLTSEPPQFSDRKDFEYNSRNYTRGRGQWRTIPNLRSILISLGLHILCIQQHSYAEQLYWADNSEQEQSGFELTWLSDTLLRWLPTWAADIACKPLSAMGVLLPTSLDLQPEPAVACMYCIPESIQTRRGRDNRDDSNVATSVCFFFKLV